MPFGAVTQRLGIANVAVKNASSFGTTVLRLPAGFPVYQQQLVHNQVNSAGPKVAAEWCGTADSEIQHTATLREISAHDTQFARRNLYNPNPPNPPYHWLTKHRDDYSNQVYYVGNEPELECKVSNQGTGGRCNCWDPPDRTLDPSISSCFPSPTTQFWENTPGDGVTVDCGIGSSERIRANALAYVYLRLKSETGGGHIVLPPSSAGPLLGKATFHGVQNPADYQYWIDFSTSFIMV
ncbi:MAG: hypothetical protein L0Y56_18035 [Nitrospira sp.]|nr:hypothetical protein [Nitrospira sp.]